MFDIDGILQLLNSDHVRERDKALLRSILVGEEGGEEGRLEWVSSWKGPLSGGAL